MRAIPEEALGVATDDGGEVVVAVDRIGQTGGDEGRLDASDPSADIEVVRGDAELGGDGDEAVNSFTVRDRIAAAGMVQMQTGDVDRAFGDAA